MALTKVAGLVEQTLRMALGRRHPHVDLLHHSDQGSEYTSASYQAVLKSRGIQTEHEPNRQLLRQCGDGAVFGTLKRECPMHFTTHQQARCAIFDSIEGFYNRVRRHSTLGYLSPLDFELSKR
jgi:putative transposase